MESKDKTQKDLKHQAINVALALVTFCAIVMGVAYIGLHAFGDEPEQIEGQVDAREYRVSAKVPARIKKVLVEEGQYVHAGDTLAILEAPEMDAQERAAQATADAAQAVSDMNENGSRHEDVSSASELVNQAEAALDIARKTYQRAQNLLDEGVITAQKRDEAQSALQVAQAQVKAARARYEMTLNGARREQRRAAAEQAKAARNGIDVVSSLLRETVQIAALDGEVDKIFAHEGEYVGNGSPIMSINILDDVWGKFNIREDKLQNIRPGTMITAYSPTYRKNYKMQVYYMEAEDDYATWKALKPREGYDVRTFEVRARPTDKNARLRPGMLLVLK